ncbi:hypothetical protein C8R46DRAFT_1044526 [Mycena filopes]|nr:hypothetical protein C8R46DRAFT_1044526 [Mycena filopes]
MSPAVNHSIGKSQTVWEHYSCDPNNSLSMTIPTQRPCYLQSCINRSFQLQQVFQPRNHTQEVSKADSTSKHGTSKAGFSALIPRYCSISTKGSRGVTRHHNCSLNKVFIDRQSAKITIYGRPASAGRKFLLFFSLIGPQKSFVTVTKAKIVQFTGARHPSPEPLVKMIQ